VTESLRARMDPFALLSSGAKFDKRKQAARPKPTVNFTVAQPLPELPSEQQQPRKKRKKQHGATAGHSDGADAGISLFAGSMQHAVQQQPQQQQQQEPALPVVHTKDPYEEANVIRKALRIKVIPV